MVKDRTLDLERAIYLFEEQRRAFLYRQERRKRLKDKIEPLG